MSKAIAVESIPGGGAVGPTGPPGPPPVAPGDFTIGTVTGEWVVIVA